MWFKNTDQTGCIAWDSRYGQTTGLRQPRSRIDYYVRQGGNSAKKDSIFTRMPLPEGIVRTPPHSANCQAVLDCYADLDEPTVAVRIIVDLLWRLDKGFVDRDDTAG
jgi:hypothetical protein